jgi:hypothetical protein
MPAGSQFDTSSTENIRRSTLTRFVSHPPHFASEGLRWKVSNGTEGSLLLKTKLFLYDLKTPK